MRIFSPISTAADVAGTNGATRLWISKQKALCWKCQKDVPRHLGKFSLLVPHKGGGLNADNNKMKFICFVCKPDKTDEIEAKPIDHANVVPPARLNLWERPVYRAEPWGR